jgi:hypothetical protein
MDTGAMPSQKPIVRIYLMGSSAGGLGVGTSSYIVVAREMSQLSNWFCFETVVGVTMEYYSTP